MDFAAWGDGKARLDRRIQARRPGAVADAGVGATRFSARHLSTTMHERLGIQPHIVEAILGHVGHQAGVAGRYNKSTYLAEKASALARWACHVRTIVEGGERGAREIIPITRGAKDRDRRG